jgi:uncharacterized ferritin-like protein (DUF455 family)
MKLHIRQNVISRNALVLTGKEASQLDHNPPLQTKLYFDNLHISPETYKDTIEVV